MNNGTLPNSFSYIGMVTLNSVWTLQALWVGGKEGLGHSESGPLKPQLPGGSGDLLTTEAVWECEANTVSNQNNWEKKQN